MKEISVIGTGGKDPYCLADSMAAFLKLYLRRTFKIFSGLGEPLLNTVHWWLVGRLPVTAAVRMPPLQTDKKTFGFMQLCKYHQMGGQ